MRPGEMLLQQPPNRAAEIGITLGMGEQHGAGDDFAAGLSLSFTDGHARISQLATGGELIGSR